MFRELVHSGDKIDVRFVQQIEKKDASSHVYRCLLQDITDDGDLEISMPVESNRLVLLPLGIRFEFVFYTEKGLYHSIGQIKERYKKNNMHMLLVELHSQLKKYQRREYYRYSCCMDAQFYFVSKDDVDTKTTEQIVEELRDDDFYEKQKKVSIHDLSGGGVRMVSGEKVPVDSYILLIMHLSNEDTEQQFFLKGRVLDSERMENNDGKFASHVQFIFQNDQVKEEIIRYIFEKEKKDKKTN